MKPDFANTLLAAVCGVIGGLLSAGVLGYWRRWRLNANLSIYVRPPHQNNAIVRVKNGWSYPLTMCWAYINVDFSVTDIIQPPGNYNAHISPAHNYDLHEDRLCWSVQINGGYTPVVDIYSGEAQALTVFKFNRDGNWIGIMSETMDNPFRVFLNGGRVYRGTMAIISKDTYRKDWEIKIDLRQTNPIAVREISCWFDPAENW